MPCAVCLLEIPLSSERFQLPTVILPCISNVGRDVVTRRYRNFALLFATVAIKLLKPRRLHKLGNRAFSSVPH